MCCGHFSDSINDFILPSNFGIIWRSDFLLPLKNSFWYTLTGLARRGETIDFDAYSPLGWFVFCLFVFYFVFFFAAFCFINVYFFFKFKSLHGKTLNYIYR